MSSGHTASSNSQKQTHSSDGKAEPGWLKLANSRHWGPAFSLGTTGGSRPMGPKPHPHPTQAAAKGN